MDPLLTTLRKVRWLLGFQQWIRFVVVGLIGGLTGCCAWLVVTRLFPLLAIDRTPYAGVLAIGVLVSVLWGIRRRPDLLQAALETDRRLALNERFTSSLQLARAEGPMVDALHEDARRHLAHLELRKAFPFFVPRSTRWLALPLLAFGVGYVFLPEFDLFGFSERQVQAKAKEEARRVKAERIEAAARPLKESGAIPNEALADAARAIERLAEELAAGKLTEKQALAKLTDLGEQLQQRREALQPEAARPNLKSELGQLGATRELAQNILNGRFGAAARQARELQKKLEEGGLSDEEKKKAAEDLKKLSDLLKGQQAGESPALSEALAQTAAGLKLGDLGAGGLQLDPGQAPDGELSLEDVASILEQLDKLNMSMCQLGDCQLKMLGPSEFCRFCGVKLKACQGGDGECPGCGPGHACYGMCGSCSGSGWGQCGGFGVGPWRPGYSARFGRGMGGPGRGRGASTGPLPDVADSFVPTMLPGEMTKGKFLASIVQRAAPNQDAEPTQDFIAEVLVEATQEAEKALTKEEIPPGAREFVRQYFGSLESEKKPEVADESAIETLAEPGTAFIQQ